jgi:hypothetical protein
MKIPEITCENGPEYHAVKDDPENIFCIIHKDFLQTKEIINEHKSNVNEEQEKVTYNHGMQ